MADKKTQIRTAPPTEKELVRLYNKTERSFTHTLEIGDKDKTKITYVLPAVSFARVAPEIADLWLGMFPTEITTDAEAQKLVAGAEAEAAELKKQLAAKDAELAAAKAKSDPKGELAKAQARIAALEADLEKATAPADAAAQV